MMSVNVLVGLLLAAGAPAADPVTAVIHTPNGPVTLALAFDAAPVSTCNFVYYATEGRYASSRFFRTVVAETNANPHPIDVVQIETTAGSDDPGFSGIPLERTRDTGLRHVEGAVSFARDGPDTATSSFFIVLRDTPALDFGGGRNPDGQGFAVFGRVVEGLKRVREIQMSPAVDEQLATPVIISDIEITVGADQCPARLRGETE